MEAGGATARLLRAPSPGMEFVERDGKGELKWSEMEGGRFGRSSSSHGNAAGENEFDSSAEEPVLVNQNINSNRSISRSSSHGIRIALDRR